MKRFFRDHPILGGTLILLLRKKHHQDIIDVWTRSWPEQNAGAAESMGQ